MHKLILLSALVGHLLEITKGELTENANKNIVRNKNSCRCEPLDLVPPIQYKDVEPEGVEGVVDYDNEELKQINGAKCEKGGGDQMFTDAFYRSQITPFLNIFNKRTYTSEENQDGLKFDQSFNLWCMIQFFKPSHIIQSGIHSGGLDTWFIRQTAGPDVQIIVIDSKNTTLKYKDDNERTVYYRAEKFRDFEDIDWHDLEVDIEKTLVFFDDNQNQVERAMAARDFGLRHLIFNNNYQVVASHYKQAYHYSIRHACAVYSRLVKRGFKVWDKNGQRQHGLMVYDRIVAKEFFDERVEVLYEFPRMFWNDAYRNSWNKAIFNSFEEFKKDYANSLGSELRENSYDFLHYEYGSMVYLRMV